MDSADIDQVNKLVRRIDYHSNTMRARSVEWLREHGWEDMPLPSESKNSIMEALWELMHAASELNEYRDKLFPGDEWENWTPR